MLKLRCAILLLLFGVVFIPRAAHAVNDDNVVYALKEASKNRWQYANELFNTSNDQTVKDALTWYRYAQGSNSGSFQEVTNFITRRSDWPYSHKLQLEAEKHLTDNDRDLVVIEWFDKHEPLTASGVDRYLNALKARGHHKRVTELLAKWWPEMKLTRDQQRSFFQRYGRYLSKDMHKKRFNALLHWKDYSNAQGIANVLGGGHGALLSAHRALTQKKSDVNGYISKVPPQLQSNEALMFERLKWRRQNDLNDGAIEILNKAPHHKQMHSARSWWRERHIIARRLIEQKNYKKAYRLVSSHKQAEGFPMAQAEWLSGWLALRFVDQKWKAFEHFEKLYNNVQTPISKARGAYWAGRASETLKHPTVATQWYQSASRFPETFYGQLASEKIDVAARMDSGAVPAVDQGQRNRFRQTDLVRAARWFSRAGLDKQASVFLLKASQKNDNAVDYVLAAEMASKMDLKHTSIKIAQNLQKNKNISLKKYLYPTITRELQNIRYVEWAFANAIIRQESRFDEHAVSHAGARGLMQLMPATAREVASRNNIKHQTSWLTSRPSHNISLGTRYLSQMLQRFDNNYAMAAAAYNAGPRRVDNWVKEFGDPRRREIDLIDWIELIPIYETRNYVQRVLEGVYVYRDNLRGQQKPPVVHIHVAAR